MSLNITCSKCEKELKYQGALAFSPPDCGTVEKYNICGECWVKHVLPLFGADFEGVSAISFMYVNWKGVRSKRSVIPVSMFFGRNEWHKESQWLLEAYDIDKQDMRTFSMEHVIGWKPE